MWRYLSPITSSNKQVKNLRKSGRNFESRNINLYPYLKQNDKEVPQKESFQMTPYFRRTHRSMCYKFEFKNLVLAGGGAKGVAYCGVARALEEHGILQHINRFAGTSTGAVVAALLSFGFNSFDLEALMNKNMDSLLRDSWYISVIPNAIRHFGWHQADKFKKFIGDVIALKTDNPDITFFEAYRGYKKELCVIVTNATTKSEEYFHVKTTPDTKIRDALRMSVSIPGLLQAVRCTKPKSSSLYVDGGVLCNYPIHCFDGWYLSDDRKLPVDMYKEPFKCNKTNLETLGCLVYSGDQYHTFRGQIERKCNAPVAALDKTKLSSRWEDRTKKAEDKTSDFMDECVAAEKEFLGV